MLGFFLFNVFLSDIFLTLNDIDIAIVIAIPLTKHVATLMLLSKVWECLPRNYSSRLNRIKWKAVHISAIWCHWYYVQEFQIKSKLKVHLTHFQHMFDFYTPWKHQKTSGFLMFSGGYRSGTLVENGLIKKASVKNLLVPNLIH